MANPYDQFDAPAQGAGNPYDQFDEVANPRLKHPNLAGYGGNAPAAPVAQADMSIPGTLAAFGSGAVQGLGQLSAPARYIERKLSDALGIPYKEGVMATGFHEPQNTTERIANTVGNVAGSVPVYAAAGESLPATLAMSGILGGSETGAKGGSASEVAGSAGLSAGLGGLGYGAGRLLGKVFTPHTAEPEHQALVNTLDQAGIPMTAGQRTGSEALRYKESVLGQQIDTNPERDLVKAYTEHAMGVAGEAPGTTATQPEVKQMFQRLGQVFEDVPKRNNLTIDSQAQSEAQQALAHYQMVQPNTHQVPLLQTIVQGITGRTPGQAINGQSYGMTRSILAEMERAPSSNAADAANSRMAGDLKDIIDDAFERSIAARGAAPAPPGQAFQALQDLGALRTARQQYRTALEIERAATGGSQAANYGLLTPQSMQQAVKAVEGRRAYATGRGPLSEVTNAAAGVGRPLPQSGTGPRVHALENFALGSILAGVGAGGGELANTEMGDKFGLAGPAVGAGLGVAGAALVPSMRGHYLFNPIVQRYLANQTLGPQAKAILGALGTSGGTAAAPAVQPGAQELLKVLTGQK